MVVIHSIPEEIARLAVAHPLVMIASDGMIDEGKGHPRGAGTYARVLGRYVRGARADSHGRAAKDDDHACAATREGRTTDARKGED
jgi:hypothetical protein